jgi:XTP/dITP diphosphohydrolase
MLNNHKLVVATRNTKKIKEINRILKGSGLNLQSLDDFSDCPEVEETADTFEGNSLKKAREVSAYTKSAALADDSGLVVDALDGRPGVYSARYAGVDATDKDNCALLLKELADTQLEKRTARFVCVMSLVYTDGTEHTFTGKVEGKIGFEPRGESGFGYDPVFYPEGHERTFAQMSADEKDSLSHRGRALEALADFLKDK